MKAIVAEIDKKHMIVITDKGDFIKVKRQMSAGIGDEIELKPQKLYPAYKRLAGLAACFMACIFLSTGVYAYYTPYSYVSVDINPSISLSLNRFEKVIAVSPITEDAADLINDTKEIKNQNIDKALTTIIKSATEKGYIDAAEENQVVVVVSAKNQKVEEKLAKEVNKAAAKELSKVSNSSEVMVEKASVKSYKEALSNKVSPGKAVLADKLREVEPQLKDEEIRKMSVKEAAKRINEKKKASAAEDKRNRENGKEAGKFLDPRYQGKDDKGREDKNNKAPEKKDSRDEKRRKDDDNQRPSAADKKDISGAASNKSKTDKGNERNNDDKDRDKDKDKDKDKGRDNSKNQDNNKGKDGNEADKNKKPGDKEKNNLKRDKDDDGGNKGSSREN